MMSTSRASNKPTEPIMQQSQQQQQPLKLHLPFTPMKPPLGDHYRFSPAVVDNRQREPDAIVFKSPPLKRKSGTADHEAESSDRNPSTGYAEPISIPLQTPVSGKRGKAQERQGLQNAIELDPKLLWQMWVLLQAMISLQLVPVTMIAP